MNAALLSSKDMTWCTPISFFEKLNEEFRFVLDAAATVKSAKCKKYYTPETDGLTSPWNIAGGGSFLQSALRQADRKMGSQGLRRIAERNDNCFAYPLPNRYDVFS